MEVAGVKTTIRAAVASAVAALLVLVAAGAALAQVTVVGGTPEGAKLKNPVSTSAESVAAGRAVYRVECVPCHGESGDGHGKGAGSYGPRPADLTRQAYTYGTADGDVFDVIKNGVQPRLAMPAWGDLISETDMWNLVNYLRTLRPAT